MSYEIERLFYSMVPTLINKTWIVNLPNHRLKQWHTYWEHERLESMFREIKAGDVVYYCGAEEFDIPALVATWGAQMVMVEPSYWYWPFGKMIWEANGLPEPLFCYHGFAGPENIEIAEPGYNVGVWPSAIDDKPKPYGGFSHLNERPDINKIKLDTIAQLTEPPDFITMDTEGSELEILKGASETLRIHRPILFLSVHPNFLKDMYGQSREELLAFLDEHDYDMELLEAPTHEEHWIGRPR